MAAAAPLNLAGTPLAPPGMPAPPPPQANPVPQGYSPFDPGHAQPGAAPSGGPPGPSASPVADNALSAPTPPPVLPGQTPSVSAELPTDFNDFLKTMIRWAGPPGQLDPITREIQARSFQEQADREQDQLTEGQKRLSERMKQRANMEMDNLKPLFAEQEKRIAAAQKDVDAAQAQLPQYTPPPTLDPHDTQQFLFGLLGVSLIAGLAGRAGWERVTSSFNGAVQGLIDGDRERAESYNKDFHTAYEAAMGRLRASQERMKDIVYATDVPINQILREAEIQAKLDGAEEKYLLAQQGHIDKLRNSARDWDRMADNLDVRRETMRTQIDIGLFRLGQARGGGGMGSNLDQYGSWALAKITAGGNASPLIAATSRWASPQRAAIWNALGKEWYDSGRDPSEFNQATITLHVERAAQRWSKTRFEAMGRLEEAIKALEGPMQQAVKEVNGQRPRAANRPVNELISEFGTGPTAEHLKYLSTLAYNVGREYQTLATMPVSNAQMHWGAQEVAEKMVNRNMNLSELAGFYKAAVLEIKVNRQSLNKAVEDSMRDVMALGGTVRPEDFGLPPRPQMTDQERELKYGRQPGTAPAAAPTR